MLASTASFVNSVGGVNADNPSEVVRSDVDTLIQTLLGNNAYTVESGIQGEDRFGTAPTRDSYIAMGHTNLMRTIENIKGFIPKWQYPCSDRDIKISSEYQESLQAA